MTIERAVPEDYEGICDVLAEGDAVHEANVRDVFRPKTGPARPREFLLERIAGPGSTILVAREGARIVGVVEVVMKPPVLRDGMVPRHVALIDNVVVRATHRGRGIGTRLVDAAETWAREKGAAVTELNVWAFNASAKKLYERLGYVTRTIRMERALG
jgi:ribosomal protein S18 acetylase RimI-like enzyme